MGTADDCLKFREFETEAKNDIAAALERLSIPVPPIEVMIPNDPGRGEISSAVALRLAKSLGRKPSEIAEDLVRIINDERSKHLVMSVEAHESGYLNFRVNWDNFTAEALKELASDDLGKLDVGEGKKAIVEHTNVNPNKALHVGHARNLVLGDSLSRILEKIGYSIEVLNYIDDSGAQVADVIVGFKFLGIADVAPAGVKFDAYCGDSVYIRVNQEYEKNPDLKNKQRIVLQEIEKGVGEIAEYSRLIVDKILRDQLKTCWRLGARYDLLNWESHILRSGMWSRIFEQLKEKGLAKYETDGEYKGCWVLTNKETGEEKVLVRSDGTTVYVAKDIPYAAWKIGLIPDPFLYDVFEIQPDGSELWSTMTDTGREEHPDFGRADLAIAVIDARQSRLQDIVSEVLKDLVGEGQSRKYLHRGYEVVALSKRSAESLGIVTDREFVHMAGRKGLYINADTVLDALRSKALAETKKRNPDADEAWLNGVAEQIAVAAFRFELVKQDTDKMIVFDIEDSLKLEGETGPYLQYSYVRALRILEKSDNASAEDLKAAALLTHPKERELVKQMSMLDKALLEAGEFLSPKEVARYAHRLSSVFNEFYEAVPVNKEKDLDLRAARLALVAAFTRVLKEVLELIGVPCPQRL